MLLLSPNKVRQSTPTESVREISPYAGKLKVGLLVNGTHARFWRLALNQKSPYGAAGEIEMNADSKRKRQGDYDRAKRARRDQDQALDDALKNTFPASDPFSIGQPAPPVLDHDKV